MSKRITTGMRIEAKRIGCKPHELGGGNLENARKIDRAITAAVRKERERCVRIVDSDDKLYPSDQIRLAAAIRKGKA